MERAQREADGPKRRILEAARLKTAARAADVATPAPAATQAVVNPANAAPAAQRPRADNAEPEVAVATLPAAAAPLPVAPATAGAVATVKPVPALELATAAVSMITMPAAAPAPAPQMLNLPPPRLVSKVDPDLPSSLFRRGALRTEVVVELTVNVDGSVGNAVVRKSPNPDFEAPVLEAIRQWRFEAQPIARSHTVRLVVSPG